MLNEKLTHDEALKVLNLKPCYTEEELKAAFRRASSINHPDKGGSTEQMQKVNAAYETLKGTGGKQSRDAELEVQRQRSYELYKVFGAVVKEEFEKISLEPFIKHFEQAYGEKLNVKKKIDTTSHGVSMTWEFANLDKSIWIQTQIYVSNLGALEMNKMMSNRSDITYEFSTSSTLFVNGRKQNFKAANYKSNTDKKVFTDPEILYPLAKLKKGLETKTGKYSKKDVLLAFKSKLKVDTNRTDSYLWVRLDNASFGVGRITFMKVPTIILGEIWDKKGKSIAGAPRVTLEETEENVKKIVDFLQHNKTVMPEQLVDKYKEEFKK